MCGCNIIKFQLKWLIFIKEVRKALIATGVPRNQAEKPLSFRSGGANSFAAYSKEGEFMLQSIRSVCEHFQFKIS